MKSLKEFLSKNKFLSVMGLVALLSNFANAAVTFDVSKGFSGTIELTFFYSAVAIIIVAVASIWAVRKAIALFR